MKTALKIISYTGLGLTIVPSLLVAAGILANTQNKTLMLVGMILWFATVPFWMGKEQ
ncbi:MAG: hypothetical protein SF052_17120 [Bacteroidia bacterium]|nr:hypothetical protein [Bacteroidia bacterium]